MEKKLIYLACPYSSPKSEIREFRYQEVCKVAASLMKQGFLVFSPIAHSHYITLFFGKNAISFDFWREFDLRMLGYCDELWILKLDGWEESVGIKAEIEFAKSLGKRVVYFMPNEDFILGAKKLETAKTVIIPRKPLGQELFEEVSQIINFDRQGSYGKPEDSFGSIARRWTEYIHNTFLHGQVTKLNAKDVAFMMMELKMARESNKHKRDNILDLFGYAALLEEMKDGE